MLLSFELIQTHLSWLLPAFSFIFGACVGSFLNVCIYRIPKGKSIVKPRSHCACGQPIVWYDNVPILSWFILRGRARCCGRSFSIRYPLIEVLTGGLFLLCWSLFPSSKAICGMIFCALLIGAIFTDFDHMVIPDCFTIGGFVVGLTLALAFPLLHGYAEGPYLLDSFRSLITALVGAFIGSALVLWIGLVAEIILHKEAMGFGDVKFMGAIGAFCGWQGAVFTLFGGAIIGTIGFLFFLLGNFFLAEMKQLQKDEELPQAAAPASGKNDTPFAAAQESAGPTPIMGKRIPFGPMLAVAGLLYFLYLHKPVDAYFADISRLFFVPLF